MKIIFMGTPEFAVPILKSIYNSKHKIISVYTQPPKKKLRGQKIMESPVQIIAKKLNIEVRTPYDLNNNSKELNFIKNTSPEIVVVAAYGQILPKSILENTKTKFINIHASLLPKLRGAAPIQRSILDMHNETGISIMKIIPKLDAGPFMLQEKIKIEKEDDFSTLSIKLSNLGSKMILDSINLLESGKAIFKEQNEKDATYAKKIKKSDAEIKWNLDAGKLLAKIKALNPYPGAYFYHNGNRIKILKAVVSDLQGEVGKVLDDELNIGCLKNSLKIKLIQKEGKKILNTKEFLSGYKIKKGEILN